MGCTRVVAMLLCGWLWICASAIASPTVPLLDPLRAGTLFLQQSDYASALDQFTQAIERSPELAYSNRCLTHLQLQQYSSAAADCQQALLLNPSRSATLLNLGLAYHSLGQYTSAEQVYQRLLQLAPDDYRAHYNLGLTQAAVGEHESAIAQFSQSLHTASQLSTTATDIYADIYRDRGVSYMLLADYPAAISDLDRAIQLLPNDLWAHFNRGCANHRSRHFANALQDFSWVVHHDAQNAQAYFNRGLIYAEVGEQESAIANLQQAAQHFRTQGLEAMCHRAQQLVSRLQAQSAPDGGLLRAARTA